MLLIVTVVFIMGNDKRKKKQKPEIDLQSRTPREKAAHKVPLKRLQSSKISKAVTEK